MSHYCAIGFHSQAPDDTFQNVDAIFARPSSSGGLSFPCSRFMKMEALTNNNPEKILRVEDVTVSFDGFLVLKKLNFSMERGELRVVIGPNGAGKTTLLDVITGKVRPAKGRVLFQPRSSSSQDITKLSEERIALLGVGRKFQTPNVFKSQTVLDNLHLAAKASRRVLPNLFRFRRNGSSRIDEVLETIGLAA